MNGKAVFIAACISQLVVATCAILHEFVEGIEILPFLWLNPLGAFLTIGIAVLISTTDKGAKTAFQFQDS